MRYLMLLSFILVSACANTTDNYGQKLQNYVGVSETVLISDFGMPDNVQSIVPGEQLYTYMQVDNVPVGGNNEPYAGQIAYGEFGMNPNLPANPNPSNNYYCQTTFTIQNGIVTDFSFNGDDCVVEDSW